MTLEFLMKHVTDAVKMHLDYLEIDAIDGGSILPHEINDDEVIYRLVVKRAKNRAMATLKTHDDQIATLTPSISSACTSTSDACRKCPRYKSTERDCEFFDNGICRGVVYPTYPPQYDPCVYTNRLEARQ